MAAESTAEFRPNNFSLWLVPDQESASKLGAVMQEEAARFQGMPFPPHLTLLGHIGGNVQKLQEQAGQLAARLRVSDWVEQHIDLMASATMMVLQIGNDGAVCCTACYPCRVGWGRSHQAEHSCHVLNWLNCAPGANCGWGRFKLLKAPRYSDTDKTRS